MFSCETCLGTGLRAVGTAFVWCDVCGGTGHGDYSRCPCCGERLEEDADGDLVCADCLFVAPAPPETGEL